ncbi:tetratricopeptide repeat protein [Clostridium sp. DL1XJH146]
MEKFNEILDKLKAFMQKIDKKILIGVIATLVAIITIYIVYAKVIKVNMYEKNLDRIEEGALLIEEGDKYLYQGDYDKAIEIYDSIDVEKVEDEKKTESLTDISLSKAYYLKGDNENSQKYYEMTEELACQDDQVLNSLASFKLAIGDIEGALAKGEEYLEINNQNKELIKTLIAANLYNEDITKAEELLGSYPLDTTSATDLAQFALINFVMNKDEDGYKYLYDAWNIDKDEIKIYDALVQLALFHEKDVIDTLNKKIEENPDEIAYKMWLAKIYSGSINNSSKAIDLVNEIKDQNTGNFILKSIEATALNNLGEKEQGSSIIEELVTEKDNYIVNHIAAWYYYSNNDFEKALEYCEKSIEENKDYSDNYAYLMPEILIAQENTVAIDANFLIAKMKEPYNYFILDRIASYYIMIDGGLEVAEKYYLDANKMNPEEAEILYSLAILDANNGEQDKAIELLKEAITLDENNGNYHRMLGSLYLLAGMNDEGIESLRTAYKLDEEDILTLNNAACYYITFTDDIYRGYYNLMKAYDGLNDDVDEYYRQVITENYEKAKGVIDQIENGAANTKVEVPDFVLLF